jgi:hypothetical protein
VFTWSFFELKQAFKERDVATTMTAATSINVDGNTSHPNVPLAYPLCLVHTVLHQDKNPSSLVLVPTYGEGVEVATSTGCSPGSDWD